LVPLPQPTFANLDNQHAQQPPQDVRDEIRHAPIQFNETVENVIRYAPIKLHDNVDNEIINPDTAVNLIISDIINHHIQREQENYSNRRQREDNMENRCSICLTNKINCALIRCGHACCCNECGTMLLEGRQTCPICRADVESILKIFIS